MNLNKTWVECLRMWHDITTLPEYINMNVGDAKRKWKLANGYASKGANCFFCHYSQVTKTVISFCANCPGVLVDKTFNCCNRAYSYDIKPKKFYQELVRLNKIRLGYKWWKFWLWFKDYG